MTLNSDWKQLKTIWVGDVHLGHPDTPTLHILSNLYHAFPDSETMASYDILFIEGDLFDRLLSLPDVHVKQIKLWMFHLLKVCKKYDIALRVLEGTPSHDWKQSKLFVDINEDMGGINADLKYVDKLCIDYEKKWNVHVLYVPDEWRPTPEQTQNEVVALLKKEGLEKVDIACMHGHFAPQLHSKLAHQAHDLDFYLEHVRYFVGIGHVHSFWRHKHIVATGSFDRVGHGEEEPKGHTVVTLIKDKPGCPDVQFIENKRAKKYVTVDCRGKDYEAAKADTCRMAESLPDNSGIRILCEPNDTIIAGIDFFRSTYPRLNWKVKRKDKNSKSDSDEQMVELIDIERKATVIAITPDNISDLLRNRLEATNPSMASKAIDRFNAFLNVQ